MKAFIVLYGTRTKNCKELLPRKSQNNLRIREFDTTDSIKFSKDLKKVVGVQGKL